jgi:iron complex outermembrane recepter protein
MSNNLRIPTLLLSALFVPFTPELSAAEEPSSGTDQDALQEVLVTAQRTTENVQDVPIAITAISSADLERRGVRQAADIVAAVPNFTESFPYGEEAQPVFSIRGVTTNDWSENQSSPIAMYVDEIYKSVGALQSVQSYDLDRVEVLRGPQGTLYGKNATGGAVNFYSTNPSLTDYNGYVTAGASNFHGYSAEAAYGGPIVEDTFGWRLAFLYDRRDGWMDSTVPGVDALNGIDDIAGRLSLLYKPTPELSILFKDSFMKSGGTPYGLYPLNLDPNPASPADPVGTGCGCSFSWFENGAKYAIDKDIHNDGASLKIDWQISEHYTATSVTGFDYGYWFETSDDGPLGVAPDGSAIHVEDPDVYGSSIHSFSEELRLQSHGDGALNWLAGAYFGHDNTHATVQYSFFNTTCNCYGFVDQNGTALWGFNEYNNFDQVRDTKAAFLNLTYQLNPVFTLRAGARYTHDDLTIRNFYALEGGLAASNADSLLPYSQPALWTQTIPVLPSTYVTYQPGLAPQGATNPELEKANSNVSAKAGVDAKLSQDVLAYFSFTQGYRGAAFNGQAYNGPEELTFAEPERLNAYELGIKSEFAQHRVQINSAVFYYDYHDQQFLDTYCAFPVAGGCAGTGLKTTNAPRSRIIGGELEIHAKPTPSLEVTTNFGVLNARYTELFLHGLDRSGNSMILAPDFSMGVDIDWRAIRLDTAEIHADVNGNIYSKTYFDAENTERITQGSYGVVNARIYLRRDARPGLTVAIWGKNLANRQYLTYTSAQKDIADGGLGYDYALVGEPRTFGIEATLKF